MKRALLRNYFLYARNFLRSPSKFNTNQRHILSVRLASLVRPRLRFYSSNSAPTHNNNASVEFDDVSNEELKKRIDKYLEGDEDAIPSIFEAILSRKLAGKHEESDNELLEEIRHKTDNHQDQDNDSEED
ncbi:hypothetical protein Ddye_015438 [Dipteronia dyeriana]|uniref:Uncharacterized protein n=1 Tax=Dipteronia dyeriana TaxID=168575 RepID=A0AAD9U5G0_9ROSI|nr:hypothetical protein Ddye_015438 [Dipteronia dyeriana]